MPAFKMHPGEGREYEWFTRYVPHQIQQLRDDYSLPELRRGEVAITAVEYPDPILVVEGNAAGFTWLHDLLVDQQPEIERLGQENFRLRERLRALGQEA